MDRETLTQYGWMIFAVALIGAILLGVGAVGTRAADEAKKHVFDNTEYYEVILDANGGELEDTNLLVRPGKSYGYIPTPTREGKTFAGWYTAKEGGIKITSSTIFEGSSGYYLYARWI